MTKIQKHNVFFFGWYTYEYISCSSSAMTYEANGVILSSTAPLKSALKATVFHQSVFKYPSSGTWQLN